VLTPRLTFVNKGMSLEHKDAIIKFLKEYVDCFTRNYREMPRLSQKLVEHQLPIKSGFKPYKQPARRFNLIIHDRVKEEVERLLDAGFIRPCRYTEWVSYIIPMEKKGTGKIWVCIGFHKLNKATHKDEYPMLIADMLINNAFGHRVIIFLDGNAGYNQIFMAEEGMSKTAFRCPSFIGLFEWVVMTFDLKNAGATYQRAMNLIFHDFPGIILEIYIDDGVVKSDGMDSHLADLHLALERMRRYGLKMNPLKCVFGVSTDKFLAFIIHEPGIEIGPKNIVSISKVQPPQCKNDMQKNLGKLNCLRRFIFNLLGKIIAFAPMPRVKNEANFTWGANQQRAFDDIKRYLSSPSVMKAHIVGILFRLYITAKDSVIGAILTQVTDGKEHIIAYLSRCLINAETRYSFIEKLCLSLVYTFSKLRHYLLSSTCIVACETDVIKHLVTSRPSARTISLIKIVTGHHYKSNNYKVIHHIYIARIKVSYYIDS
jgi:hypothetical protein